eukprot:1348919-Rhodomonas_salina.2
MSRDDEFSVNPRSLYIVVVKADEQILWNDEADGDYRMVLHRILFHTGRRRALVLVSAVSYAMSGTDGGHSRLGRVPIVAISGDHTAEHQVKSATCLRAQ